MSSKRFISTRGKAPEVDFSTAVEQGLAPDGGLYLPQSLPDLGPFLEEWSTLSYPELAAAFMERFADEAIASHLDRLTKEAYRDFRHPDTAPLVRLSDRLQVLELFHGPTLAFKDFALQLLGGLYEEQIHRTGKEIAVLGATSGDTGAAAIHGLMSRQGVKIFILYPDGRISPLQERQMACTGSSNVFPIAIKGSFDDAQEALKEVFGDGPFAREVGLSAVNSINLARILAQSVYYLYAWFRLDPGVREQTQFVVPTGNFGNVLAGWMLTRMGVSLGGFIVATNQNDILHRFFKTGLYQRGDVAPSVAPSMDIQVASNFERFLFYVLGEDPSRVSKVMGDFRASGSLSIPEASSIGIGSTTASDAEIGEIIARTHRTYGYLPDPHTACGFKNLGDGPPKVILATAHPAKFPETIERATGLHPKEDRLEALKSLPIKRYTVEPKKEAIQAFIREHRMVDR